MIKILTNVHQFNMERDNGQTFPLRKNFQELKGSYNMVAYKLIYSLSKKL